MPKSTVRKSYFTIVFGCLKHKIFLFSLLLTINKRLQRLPLSYFVVDVLNGFQIQNLRFSYRHPTHTIAKSSFATKIRVVRNAACGRM